MSFSEPLSAVLIHFNFVSLFLSLYIYSHRGQKRAPDPLELELRVVVSSLTWVLGTELLFFTTASSPLTSERLARLLVFPS